MKKLLYLCACTMCFFFINASQADAQIGVRAGLNMSNVSGDVEGNASKMGFHFGLVYETAINESLSFTPGVLYSTKGSKDDVFDESTSVNYIEIPLDLGYALTDALSLNVGPYIGLLMSASFGEIDIKDSLSSLDFGINAGLSYDINPVSIGLGYGLGLANINDEGEESIKNTNITVYLTYPF